MSISDLKNVDSIIKIALGLNGEWSFGPVGGFVSPNDPPVSTKLPHRH